MEPETVGKKRRYTPLGEREDEEEEENEGHGGGDANEQEAIWGAEGEARGVGSLSGAHPLQRPLSSKVPSPPKGRRQPALEEDHDDLEDGLLLQTLQLEVDRLRAENARLRKELEELRPLGDLTPAKLLLKVKNGPETLKYAPADLFIVYSIKLAECVAYYGFAYVYVTYLSEELGFTDEEAGDLYSVYGLLCTVVGLQMGYVIDRLGVRRSTIIGTVASTLARGISLVATTKWWACFVAVTFFPVGAAFGVPVLALGVRRYTHEDNRGFAFSFFYAVLCLACLLGSIIINRVRAYFPEPILILGYQLSWLRIVLLVCTGFTAYTVVAACFLRDIQVLSDRPLKDRVYCVYKPRSGSMKEAMKEVVGQRRFWRLAAVTLIFCGVRMTFRHLDATFPKYFTRTFGPQAPFELILCINPIVTMVATPLVTSWLLRKKVPYEQALMVGAFVSGASIFCLAAWESFSGAIAFVLMLSIGEAIWSPKLYEFSTMSAPEGREGIYVAITMAPMYLASVPVGTLSGWALGQWCPKGSTFETRQTRLMWFVLGLIGFSSPVLLWIFRRSLFRPGDDKPPSHEEGEGEQRARGLSKLPNADKDDNPFHLGKKAQVLDDEEDDDNGGSRGADRSELDTAVSGGAAAAATGAAAAARAAVR